MSDTQYTPSSTTSIPETSTRKASKMVVTKYKAAAVTSEPSVSATRLEPSDLD
jgi:hypothetical protein